MIIMSNDKKHIIFITRILSTGGAERVISELANDWVKKGLRVTIVQMEPLDDSANYGISPDVEIINFHPHSRNFFAKRIKEVFSITKILRKNPDAAAISFVFSANYVLAAAKLFVRNKIILSERNDPNAMSRKKAFVQKSAFRLADVCVFQTNDAMNWYPESIRKKGIIIPNPINPNLPERYEGVRDKVIVTASRLDPQKNLAMLINAFSEFQKSHPDYTLKIYGRAHMSGNTEMDLKQLVQSLGLEDKILFMGFSTKLHEEIKNSAIYVCSSDYEGISNSVLEALAMGIPTISTDCPIGGSAELIENGINGVLIPVGDQKALAIAMLKIADDRDFQNKLSLNAFEIRKKYPINKISDMWIELFNRF